MKENTDFKGPILLLKDAWNTFKKYPMTYFKIIILSILASLGLIIVLGLLGFIIFALTKSVIAAALLTLVPGIPALIYVQAWFGLALTSALLENSDGKNVTVRESLSIVKPLILPYFFLQILTGFIILGGALLFLIPALILSIWFSVSNYVFIKEGKRGLLALLTSREYVRGFTGILFVYYLLFMILSMIITGVVNTIFDALDIKTAGQVANFIINLIIGPLGMLLSISVYRELRRVKGEVTVQNYNARKVKYLALAVLGIAAPILIIISMMSFAANMYETFKGTGGELENIQYNWEPEDSDYLNEDYPPEDVTTPTYLDDAV